MRHQKAGKKLGRDVHQRKALLKGLINALVLHEELETTETKAKVIKGLTDRLISRAKQGTVHARRILAAFLQNTKAVNKLVDELSPRFKDRAGGFTRILRLGERRGDNAMLVKMEFVEKARDKTTPAEKPQEEKDKPNEKPKEIPAKPEKT